MIGIYLGRQGYGKTLNMVSDAYIQYRAYQRMGVRLPIFSNFPLNQKYLPHERIYTISDLFIKCRRGLLLLDEIGATFDSRLFSSAANTTVSSKLIAYLRKRELVVRSTSQFLHLVEKRWRDNCHWAAECFPVGDGFVAQFFDPALGTMGKSRFLMRDPFFFNLYDTKEEADVLEFDDKVVKDYLLNRIH